jgi:hypothetical protein
MGVGLWGCFASPPAIRHRVKARLWDAGFTASGLGCALFAWIAWGYSYPGHVTGPVHVPLVEEIVGGLAAVLTGGGALLLLAWKAM